MITLTFIEHSGEQHVVTAEPGCTLMQAAVDNGVPGIDADCGGACACGTCHVIVAQDWLSKTATPSDSESTMLEMTPDHCRQSRLACQITLSEPLDGMVVELPEFQM
ncbi:2Fe-2S iron-sulfur cluster-binding protein [Spongiibacter sp.]|uniref:2Fe-2S iron-sulfur cluster-binding protein n=1 Tax=Spongiibacter sp. TaxID=2024860 RepID=UPI0035667CAA